jgi:hypothetical protein
LKLFNNSPQSCYLGMVGLYYSLFGSGGERESIETVVVDSTYAPGETAVINVPYTIPPSGQGCLIAQFTTDCCDTAITITRCFQSVEHCVLDSNVCYQGTIELGQVPIYDTTWYFSLPSGWTFWALHEPAIPLYGPDELIFEICTPGLGLLGDTAGLTLQVFYDEEGTIFDKFVYTIGNPSRTGDVNQDCRVNIGDAVYLLNYIFHYGTAPIPLETGDANCDGSVNIGDAVYLLNFIFLEGPSPCYYEYK